MPLDIRALREKRPQNEFHYSPVTPSTMIEAAELADAGAPHGTIVIADEQTAGVGRFGRQWHSEPETGIYCSILLRVAIPPSGVPIVTLALGLAVAEAIERCTNLACDLRWPNDVLVNDRKVAGILAQLHQNCVVAGIGINVNQKSLPADLRTPATSLAQASGGRAYPREDLVIALLDAVDDFSRLLVERGPEAILSAFAAASSYVMHRRVLFENSRGGLVKGVTVGLDENGFLRVRDDSGLTQTIYTGGVRPDPS